MAEHVFQVTYVCNNCNHTFKEKYEKGTEVKQVAHERAVVERHEHSEEVRCPNCDSKRITVAGRQIFR